MVIFLIRLAIFLGSSALGLWVTSLVLDGFDLSVSGFVAAVIVFTVVQSVLAPFIASIAKRYASAFLGGVGLVSTFIALLVATAFTGGLEITGGVGTWIAAVVLVWLVTAIATWLLPFVFLRRRLQERQADELHKADRRRRPAQ
ncbi:phage holin family protein [Cellulomonas denverensis]|uniref:Phage holin family protein n=1 Tax=Cellulomonas denverensis TaxID=264297 RepID=A0A7X6KSJ8_9CELL|nr:phage holin family protein [Cellulomonas denverensis]NKY21467.1 phage holin family protein [Cellulomonas denverensis]GIG27394.1 membrane protein [Cellulomonas denverensis]